jgi:2-methylcitrate dehydratase PrpD
VEGDWARLLDGFGERWVAETIAFKPYACGTMIHPYIDCARRLAPQLEGRLAQVKAITCDTAEGIVHRLWEPLAVKHEPQNAYAAKFSVPFCVSYALRHGFVGLEAFTDANASDRDIRAIASRVGYRVDPANPYPNEYTGHLRVELADGTVLEERQPHLRGGHREPLTRAEIEEKFRGNCRYGGWDERRAEAWLALARTAFDVVPDARIAGNDPGPHLNLSPFRG